MVGIINSSKLRRLNNQMILGLSLCVSDLTVGVTRVARTLVWIMRDKRNSSYPMLVFTGRIMFFTSAEITLLTIITMAMDNYIAIVKPLHHVTMLPRRRMFICIALNWLIPVVYNGVLLASIPVVNYNNNRTLYDWSGYQDVAAGKQFLFCITVLVIIASVLMLFVYCRIINVIRTLQDTAPENNHARRVAGHRKATMTTIWIVATFLLAWLPYIIVSLSQYHFKVQITRTVSRAIELVPYVNAICDPMIYAIRLKKVRAGLRAACCRGDDGR